MNEREEKVVKDFILSFNGVKESQLQLVWLIPPLIFSRKLLKNQSATKKFTTEILGLTYKDYVYKSRPLLVGKLQKDILSMDSTSAFNRLRKLTEFYTLLSNPSKSSNSNQKESEDTFFSEWSKYLTKDIISDSE